MAQLNTPALNALNAAIGGRSESVSGKGSNAPGEQKGFAQMMAGAIENQKMTTQGQSVTGRSQSAVDAQAMESNQSTGATAEQTGVRQMHSVIQKQISALQQKIQTLMTQDPPLPDHAQSALSELTQRLALLKSQVEQNGGSFTLDKATLSEWQAQLDKIKTLLQQGDANAASWTVQLQAMVQRLAQMGGQTDVAEGRVGQSSASVLSTHSAVADDARQVAQAVPTKDAAAMAQGMDFAKKDNHTVGNQGQLQNNPTVSGGRSAVALVTGQMQSLSGAIDSALSAQTIHGHSTLSSFSKAVPKSDLILQLTEPSGNNTTASFNLSASGFGAAANTSPAVTLPGNLALNQPRMAADLGQNIQFMLNKNISRATLDVNPAHLGPMKITIDQQNNQTNIQIMASHHLAKDMLDQNMPRLREWLQDAGLGNAQVTVMSSGQDGANNQAMNQGGSSGFSGPAGEQGMTKADAAAPLGISNSSALADQPQVLTANWHLDTFA